MNFIKRILSLILYFISFLFPRNKNIWVFGSYGNFNDNSKYLYLNSLYDCSIKKIWIAKNENEENIVKQAGGIAYTKNSIKGLYYCLRAKVYIYSAYITEINFITSGGAIAVNLWHGIPLKKIEFDIKDGVISRRFNNSIKSKIFYPHIYRKHNYVLCPSEYVGNYSFKSAFRVCEEELLFDTYPRVLNLIDLKEEYNKNNHEFFNIFYAPTWRDDEAIFINDSNFNMDILNCFLVEKNMRLYVKFHNNTKINLDSEFSNIEIVDKSKDPNDYLISCDCLITDYSSIYFDYLVLNKPIIFYRFDEVEYINKNRNFYKDIYNYVPGLIVYSFNDLLKALTDISLGKDDGRSIRKSLINMLSLDSINDKKSLYCKIKKISTFN